MISFFQILKLSLSSENVNLSFQKELCWNSWHGCCVFHWLVASQKANEEMSEFEQKKTQEDSGSDEDEVPESEKTPVTIGNCITPVSHLF
jgi:hypothetical protein